MAVEEAPAPVRDGGTKPGPWRRLAWLAALAMVVPAAAAAQGHGAHVHGLGRLDIAVEGQAMEMELAMPGADVVGFEHAPETAEDRAKVAEAAAALERGATLFAFPAEAGCRLEGAEVESGLLEDDHGEEGHRDEHGQGGEAHAEFRARYKFRCERPDRLTHVEVGLFARFPAAREIEVRTITPRGQGAAELTPDSPRLDF